MKFINMSFEKRTEFGSAGRLKMENKFDEKIILDKYKKEIDYITIN